MTRTRNCVDYSAYIPSWLMVDGKPHVLASRKRCLVCQPFKERLGVYPVEMKLLAERRKCDLLCVRCHAEDQNAVQHTQG